VRLHPRLRAADAPRADLLPSGEKTRRDHARGAGDAEAEPDPAAARRSVRARRDVARIRDAGGDGDGGMLLIL
jgi:hypothetical protein